MLIRGTESINRATVSSGRRSKRWLSFVRGALIGAAVAATTYLLSEGVEPRLGVSILMGIVLGWSHFIVARYVAEHAQFLPLMRVVTPIAGPGLAFPILAFLELAGLLPLTLVDIAIVCAAGVLFSAVFVVLLKEPNRLPLRVAVVGSAAVSGELRAELRTQTDERVEIVGHIDLGEDEWHHGAGDEQPIGRMGALADAVREHHLDLLLVSSQVPRMSFFNEMEATCSHLDVRVLELASYYENTFGHVPLRAINAAWFQWVMHPRYSPRTPTSKRVLDLAIVSALAPVVLPLIGLLALLVKLDGGPVFYRQVRIGESGRTFRMLKLRSMRVDDGAPARWTAADDDRITAVGRVLRRAHLDELPQLINVLKGDMSIVGPRPEQPSFVQSLESSVQFYSRRHVVRPGITGWAQVRVGYAGSDEGTFWKLSHDLYYLKHRSVTFDLLILGETLRMLFTDTHVPLESPLPGFVRSTELETPPAEMSIRD